MIAPNKREEDRIDALDSLRGIAVLLVAVYHYTCRFDPSFYGYSQRPLIAIPFGYLGVQLFFFISGFVISMTLERCRNQFDFAWKRIARLYPAYWVAILLTTVVVAAFGLPDRAVSLRDTLINFSMIQLALHVTDVDGAYWSLFHELFFYAMISTVYFYLGGGIRRALMIFLPLPALAEWLSLHHNIGFFWFFMVQSFPFFLAGMGMYLIYVSRRLDWLSLASLLNCAAMAFAGYTLRDIMIIYVMMGLVLVVAFRGPAFFANRVFWFFGFISYSLYLIHQNIGLVIVRQATAVGVPPYLAIALALAVVTGIAYLMKIWVEEPARILLLKKLPVSRYLAKFG